MKTVLLRSSGIDSVCIEFLRQPDVSVYFDLGDPYNQREIEVLPPHVVVDTSLNLGERIMDNAILPRRNAFLVLAAAYYGERIILGATAGDTTKDKDMPFMQRINALLRHMGNDPGKCTHAEVVAPYRNVTKRDLVRNYLDMGGSAATLIHASRSCYDTQAQECGVCRSCVRKYAALKLNGLDCSKNMLTDPRTMLKAALTYAIQQGRGHEIDDIQEVLKT